MIKLAIVIPYYKIDFFEKTLKSISKQSDKRFTLYIGNDASPNNPLEIIEKYFSEGQYNYYDYKENYGGQNLAKQWERILENVTEDWFQILGDDDMIAENFVEEFYNCIEDVEDKKLNLIRFPAKYINDDKQIKKVSLQYDSVAKVKDLFEDKVFFRNQVTLSENVFRNQAFRKIGFTHYPLAWYSDLKIVLDITGFNDYYFNNRSFVTIYNGEHNISNGSFKKKIKFEASQIFLVEIINGFNDKISYVVYNRFLDLLFMEARKEKYSLNFKIILSFLRKFKIKLGIKSFVKYIKLK